MAYCTLSYRVFRRSLLICRGNLLVTEGPTRFKMAHHRRRHSVNTSVAETHPRTDRNRVGLMSLILVACPKTQQSLSTGVESTSSTLRQIWNSELTIPCCHCGEVHEFKVRDAVISDAISDRALGREPVAVL